MAGRIDDARQPQAGPTPTTPSPAGDRAAALPASGIALLVAFTLVWGSNFPAMKFVLGDMPVWTFRSVCLVFGAVGLSAIALARGFSLAAPRHVWGWLGLCALFNVAAWHLLSGYALTIMPAGRAAIIGYTMPLWAVLLAAFFLGEAITVRKILALVLGLGGLGLLIGPELATFAAVPLGAFLMLLAAMCWAMGTVLLKIPDWNMPTTVLTAWQLGLAGIPITLGAILIDTPDWSLSTEAWFALFYVLFGAMLFCHWAWFTTVRLLPSSVAAISTLMIPVVGVIASALFLGEPIGWQEIAALFCVASALGCLIVPGLFARP